ncbi:galactose mutarotase [Chryseobacterium soli]|uniref:aldose epimerase family protein n=1 Tax=Chryseobacterium soli TaxID=445961 RepID=UPI0029541AF5|nr:aldose epimerase family protein [Chryseobacterium soli]MDV7695616.1 galactose mutarotase [Chryseobacterium soli]
MENIQISEYGTTDKGENIKKYTLTNKNGMTAEIINYGAIVTSLTASDKNGNYEDVVLGFVEAQDYFNQNSYFYGAIIGRFANRIANAAFQLEGKNYHLTENNAPNHLHGGKEGFFNKVWIAEVLAETEIPTLQLTYESPDGEEGYPGTLVAKVFYSLTDDNELIISYEAITDQATIINLTHHSYFNLSGRFTQAITDHELQLEADQFIPIDTFSIPEGRFQDVEGSPFDFRISKLLGKDIDTENEQLKRANGYDHCFVLTGSGMRRTGTLYHPESGRKMEVFTDQPGIQVYSGNFLDGKHTTKTGGKNTERTGICLETQHYPDAPNQVHFPSVKLFPGEKYQTKTIYKFSVEEK